MTHDPRFMTHDSAPVLIIGAGQAGITLSWHLQRLNVPHLILERENAFSSWRHRWDGFHTNTPNWMNTIPVATPSRVPGHDPRSFATREEIVDYFDECLDAVRPHLRIGVNVQRVIEEADGMWSVETAHDVYRARIVAVCTGAMAAPRIPVLAEKIPASVPQLHSSDYRNPEQIATGSVLLVGSGSSGMQICTLLAESGRLTQIHLAASNVVVLPRRILGVQVHRFLHRLGLFDVRKDSIRGKLMYARLGSGGDPIVRPTPRDVARKYGVMLHGRLTGVNGKTLTFSDGSSIDTDDLTIIWCTGFRADYSFVETMSPHAFIGDSCYPNHVRGVVAVAPGLYFVGLRYQYTVASHDIYGVGRDAEFVGKAIWSQVSRLATCDP